MVHTNIHINLSMSVMVKYVSADVVCRIILPWNSTGVFAQVSVRAEDSLLTLNTNID